MPFPARRSLEIVNRVCCMHSSVSDASGWDQPTPHPPVFLIFLSELLVSVCLYLPFPVPSAHPSVELLPIPHQVLPQKHLLRVSPPPPPSVGPPSS